MQFIDKVKNQFGKWTDLQIKLNDDYKRRISLVIFFIVIALILTFNFFPNQIDLEVGQVAKSDIVFKSGAQSKIKIIEMPRSEKFEAWLEEGSYKKD